MLDPARWAVEKIGDGTAVIDTSIAHSGTKSIHVTQVGYNAFATLRDMINWCIEKPNEGEKLAADSDAMKALEAYIYWSNRNSKLDPGRH